MGRSVRQMRSLVSTMRRVWTVRGNGDERGKSAARFLLRLCARRICCLAVQADAADEVIMFLRFLDTEVYDSAQLVLRLSRFLDRVYNLFGSKRQVLSAPGYTSFLMSELRDVPLVFVVPGGMRSVKCPSKEDLDFVFDLFGGWLKLLKATCEQEFPFWQTSLAFRMFNFKERDGKMRDDQDDADLDRLAVVRNVSRTDPKIEYDVLASEAVPVAKALGDNCKAVRCGIEIMEGKDLTHAERVGIPQDLPNVPRVRNDAFLYRNLRKQSSRSLGASELQINVVFIGILF